MVEKRTLRKPRSAPIPAQQGTPEKKPKTLAQYAAEHPRLTLTPSQQWFQEHPDVRDQVMAGIHEYTSKQILGWLKEEYAFPFSQNIIDGLRQKSR